MDIIKRIIKWINDWCDDVDKMAPEDRAEFFWRLQNPKL